VCARLVLHVTPEMEGCFVRIGGGGGQSKGNFIVENYILMKY